MTDHGTFRCEQCLQVFVQEWSDEEAAAEAHVHGFDPDNDLIVCDECFVKLMAANHHPIGQPRSPLPAAQDEATTTTERKPCPSK